MAAFKELLAELCAGIEDSVAVEIKSTGCLSINDVPFTLRQADEETDPDGLLVFCQMGPVPPGPEAADALKRLLEINLAVFRKDAPVFGYAAESDEPVLMTRLELKDVSTEGVRISLVGMSGMAAAWQETRFADGSFASLGQPFADDPVDVPKTRPAR